MIKTFNREKLINSIIYFAQNTNYCGKTKILKLLFFLDFKHFKQTGKSVTGLDYFAWDKGPVPVELFNEHSKKPRPDLQAAIKDLPEGDFKKIQPKKEFTDKYFSKRELRLLEETAYIFRDAKADEMVMSTHLLNDPWDRTIKTEGEFKKIDYMLAIDDMKDSISRETAEEINNEINETLNKLGVA